MRRGSTRKVGGGGAAGQGARLAHTSLSAKRCERVPKPSRSLFPVKRVVSNLDGMELAALGAAPACPAMKPAAVQREGRAEREAGASGGVCDGGPLFTLPAAFFPTCR